MAEIDVEITCEICGVWNGVGTIDVEEAGLFPEVFKLVQQKTMRHWQHGLEGQWRITYRPRMNPTTKR